MNYDWEWNGKSSSMKWMRMNENSMNENSYNTSSEFDVSMRDEIETISRSIITHFCSPKNISKHEVLLIFFIPTSSFLTMTLIWQSIQLTTHCVYEISKEIKLLQRESIPEWVTWELRKLKRVVAQSCECEPMTVVYVLRSQRRRDWDGDDTESSL